MNYELKITKIKLIILFTLIFFSQSVLAASLNLNVDKNNLSEGGITTLVVSLNTEGQSINTIEGDLKYDDAFVKAEFINIGSSFVNFWIEKPNLKTTGIVHFSGMTPGGVSFVDGEAFKVIFRAKKTGNTNLSLSNVSLLLNDGKGGTASVKVKNVDLKINQDKVVNDAIGTISGDKIPPEKFSFERAVSPSLFDNKYFISFSTTDKESGVDHYQICELFNCVTAESPYLLKNQTPFYYIKVNAYDMNGNPTSATLVSDWLAPFIILLILIIFISGFYIYRKFFHKNL